MVYARSPITRQPRALFSSGEQLQRDIAQHLKQLADAKLAADDVLKIDVLDIDLAGHLDLFVSAGRERRIVRDVT